MNPYLKAASDDTENKSLDSSTFIPKIVQQSLLLSPLGVNTLEKIIFVNLKSQITWNLADQMESHEAIAFTTPEDTGYNINLTKKVVKSKKGVYAGKRQQHRMLDWSQDELINITTIHELDHIKISKDNEIDFNDGSQFSYFGTHIEQVMLEFKARIQFSIINTNSASLDKYLDAYQTYFSIHNKLRYPKKDDEKYFRGMYSNEIDQQNEYKKLINKQDFKSFIKRMVGDEYGITLTRELASSVVNSIRKDLEKSNSIIEQRGFGNKINLEAKQRDKNIKAIQDILYN